MSFKHMRADLTVTRLAPLKVLAMSFALALALGSLNAQAQGVDRKSTRLNSSH